MFILALVIPVSAEMAWSVKGKPDANWWRGSVDNGKDTALLWARSVEDVIEDSTSFIWVSPDGNDTNGEGSLLMPYGTITKALASVTSAKLKIMVLPGEYSEVDIVWPNTSGIEITGIGNVSIVQATDAATPVIKIQPTSTASWSASISGIGIISDYTDGTCIDVNNIGLGSGKKINLYLNNVSLSNKAATDKSLIINGVAATAGAIRVYVSGNYNTWEGIVDFTTTNTGDRLRIYNTRLIGAITMNEAIASELTFINCSLAAPTVHSDLLLTNINCWHESDADPDVYTSYADAFSS